MRRKRPHCFTIREILVLVATVKKGQWVGYLDKVFGWYFDRTRSTAIAVGAGAVAIAVAVLSALARDAILATLVAAVIALYFVGATVWINYVLAPLHREYLDCLGLCKTLGAFSKELRASEAFLTLRSESNVEVAWLLRTGLWGRNAVADALTDRLWTWSALYDDPNKAIGQYLIENLAEVPTDQYERHARVRRVVDHCLKCARDAQAAARGSEASDSWQALLHATPPD
jgi:predicted secreted protein